MRRQCCLNKLSNLGWRRCFCLPWYGVFCDFRNPSNLSNRLVKAGLGPSITFGTQSITLYLHKVCDVALHHFTFFCRRLLCGQHHPVSLNFILEGPIVRSTLCGHLKHLNITLFWRAGALDRNKGHQFVRGTGRWKWGVVNHDGNNSKQVKIKITF